MPLDTAAFRASLSRFASGVTVLTTRSADGRDLGMTATAFSALSLDPPLVLVCIDRAASIAPSLEGATHLAIHVLEARQEALARQFALKEGDRFEGVAITRGGGGVPLLPGALVRLECRIVERHPGGDHLVVVAEVLAAELADGDPLLYFRGRYSRLLP